ncbi:MAG: metallophosphoesterase [Aquiluna sp.]|nr:metallophosphoesterase [Aquiluna sp.]
MWLTGNSGPFKLHKLEVESIKAKGLRILHISDLHFAPGQEAKTHFLAGLADLKPDLVINTGDNLGHQHAINPVLRALEPLMEFPGVFVNGSNDYRAPKPRNPLKYFQGPSEVSSAPNLDTGRFTSELQGAGWLDLNNQSGQLSINGQEIGFLGLDDPHENLDNIQSLDAQASQIDSVDLKIAVAHAPYLRVIDAFVARGADLMFAGHTHGGQVCLPGQKALVTNCDLPTKYASGLSAWGNEEHQSLLHVSNGIGCSIYAPMRLFCPPSATLITLK